MPRISLGRRNRLAAGLRPRRNTSESKREQEESPHLLPARYFSRFARVILPPILRPIQAQFYWTMVSCTLVQCAFVQCTKVQLRQFVLAAQTQCMKLFRDPERNVRRVLTHSGGASQVVRAEYGQSVVIFPM
jgi:hypothetical protein